uniref:Tripartite-type tricarboxylate transporter receptor subunit TctC n=1 Tax=Stella humosa TaxID=94 RepID=A0A3N1L0C8_9PROT|nr:tripartite tricarboxylate transporter substrate binding protein [Stella humosa]ROP84489.1 tripartite-type tricarboxylate transporter receptor subunit TctC [Stella humosa]BBK34009.1 MFS transporter [Stella humosa]
MPSVSRLRRAVLLAAAATVLSAGAVLAQAYPTKPITLIVPFPAGGTTDVLARIFAERMSADLGQRVVVDNRGTAGGTTAAAFVARSAPDGYTLFISNVSTHALAPNLYKNLTYDTMTAFAPVTLLTTSAGVLIAHPSLKAANAKEFVALVKANPGKFNYASPGNGTGGHLGMERLRTLAGLDMVHVPFNGSGPARNAVLAGEPPVMVENIQTALSPAQAGKLKVLGVAADRRSPALPDVPTLAEQGFDLSVTSWTAFFVPAATPQPIVERLHASAIAALRHEDTQRRLKDLSTESVGSTPGELGAFVKNEFDTWGGIIRSQGLKIDN